MGSSEWLKENLQKVLALPAPATEWLLMLWGAIQVFDDVLMVTLSSAKTSTQPSGTHWSA